MSHQYVLISAHSCCFFPLHQLTLIIGLVHWSLTALQR